MAFLKLRLVLDVAFDQNRLAEKPGCATPIWVALTASNCQPKNQVEANLERYESLESKGPDRGLPTLNHLPRPITPPIAASFYPLVTVQNFRSGGGSEMQGMPAFCHEA